MTGFEKMTASLAEANDLSLEQAGQYLARIGDTPELDENGLVVVSDAAGNELARLKLPERDASTPA